MNSDSLVKIGAVVEHTNEMPCAVPIRTHGCKSTLLNTTEPIYVFKSVSAVLSEIPYPSCNCHARLIVLPLNSLVSTKGT